MHNKFTESLAQFIADSPEPQVNKPLVFRWINPMPKFLKSKQSNKLLANLPESIQDQILNNSDLIKYFQDDVRALKLYVQSLPSQQINSEPDLDDHINPEEFNNFFKENYISNQAYKLTEKQKNGYESKISQNISWQNYVLSESNKNVDTDKISPNYSIKYFLTNLTPTTRADYLDQIDKSIEDKSLQENQLTEIPVNDLPSLNTLSLPNHTEDLRQSFSTESNNQSSSTTSTVEITETSTEQAFKINQSPSINTEIDFETSQSESLRKQVESQSITLNQAQNDTQKLKNNPPASLPKAKVTTPEINNYQSQYQLTNQSPKFIKVSETKNRQKPLNYAKIVGYSSAVGISAGTGALTLLNTLFGS